jgi:hypothetical protein
LQIDRGDGFGPAANQDIDIDLDGTGSFVGGSGSCSTDNAGTCVVTVTSPEAGTSVLTATYHAEVSGTDRDFSGEGRKTWIAEEVVETPDPDQPPTTDEPPAENPPVENPPAQDSPAPSPPAGKTEVSGETAGDVAGRLDPPVTLPAPAPVNLGELPRTGAGIQEEALLALLMLLAGVSAQLLGRRRPKAV